MDRFRSLSERSLPEPIVKQKNGLYSILTTDGIQYKDFILVADQNTKDGLAAFFHEKEGFYLLVDIESGGVVKDKKVVSKSGENILTIEHAIEEAKKDLKKSFHLRFGKPDTKPLKIDKVRIPFSLPTTLNARGKANIKAIELISSVLPSQMTKKDREAVRQYTGWGGFGSVVSWNEMIKDPNYIVTEEAILYEYYTPYELTYSIRQKILPFINGKEKGLLKVPKWKGKYLALEPSAGIGRFVDPFYTSDFQWNTIEPSIQSAKVLMALYPESKTNIVKFDEWAFTNNPIGVYSMILGNPPYNKRGADIQEDPNWSDFTHAEQYQLVRTLPMLNKGGISVMVIPRETLSGKDKRNRGTREEMLKYAHLIGAIRLPTHSLIDGKLKSALFHNVATPIDVLFLQARGGKLKEVKPEDQFILDGEYFEKYPNQIMGEINPPQTSISIDGKTFENKFIYTRIIMKGKFEGLVDLDIRPMKSSNKKDFIGLIEGGKTTQKVKQAEKTVRTEKDAVLDETIIKTMNDASQAAYYIAPKIQSFIKNVQLNTKVSKMEAHAVREGINTELLSFVQSYGKPTKRGLLDDLKNKDLFRYNIFVSAFDKSGEPIKEVSKPIPLQFEYNGDPKDYNTLLRAWYKHAQKTTQFPVITESDLRKAQRTLNINDKTPFTKIAMNLSNKGWCLHPTDKHPVYWITLKERYYEGNLWKNYDALNEYLSKKNTNKALTEIYQKQLSQMIDIDPNSKKSLMDLITFPDLINERKILPSSPFVSEALLNDFFKTLKVSDPQRIKGVVRLEAPKIVKAGNTYLIKATPRDLGKTFEKFLEGSYKVTVIMEDGTKQSQYQNGEVILEREFPSVYSILQPYIDKNPPNRDVWKFTASLPKENFEKIDTKEIAPHSGFQSILSPMQQMFFGMLVKNPNIFKPVYNAQYKAHMNTKLYKGENFFGAKVRIRRELENKFLDFLSDVRQERYWEPITNAYNRQFRGYKEPNYAQGDDIIINGWKGYGLRPYQAEAVRKMTFQKQGLLAFDVGLGKTLTGIAAIALAKQQGWCQRPLIVVPNSILFKWKDDILKAIPDWNIVTIGANQFRDKNGNLKSRVDTPEERGKKWLQFSLGAYDVALLTYSMLDRTQFRERTYQSFSMKHLDEGDIFSQLAKARKDSKSEKRLLSKKKAIETKVADMLLPPKNQRIFDKGVTWEDIGVDLMLIDEAQNFKNLFETKTNFSTPPKFLGSMKPSKQSYNLDIRCMQVRETAQRKYGSNNIFLLSATPAKNSPMEFYNLIQYIDPKIFTQYGIMSTGDFYDRFLEEEHGQFYNAKLEVQEYPQIKRFINLDDFRFLLKKYCTFEVFETIIQRYPEIERTIKIPSVVNKQVRIKMSKEQKQLIDDVLWKMGKVEIGEDGEIVQSEVSKEDKISPLEGIMRMLQICIHPILTTDKFKVYDEGEGIPDDPDQKKKRKKKSLSISGIQKALKSINIHSPKLDAVASNITRLRGSTDKVKEAVTCGNIVFIQNIAVQYMIRDLLVSKGIPKWSIGIMNATELPDPQSRQNMAQSFNFVSEFYVTGDKAVSEEEYSKFSSSKQKKSKKINGFRYDIIIANSVAYEGIDLQHRTCAIHHVDLAWEPATITQRNGRGVRSGNEYEDVEVYYYIMENTVDQYMYLTIQGKREWLVSAIQSQDREINNLGASETSAETLLLLTSSSPEDYDRRKAVAKKKMDEKRIENSKRLIQSQIRKVGLLYEQARNSRDPRTLDQAQRALEALKDKDPTIYPALYYVDQLRFYAPYVFSQAYMYDVALIKGLMYATPSGTVGMYLGKEFNNLRFLGVKGDTLNGEIYLDVKEVTGGNSIKVTLPYAVSQYGIDSYRTLYWLQGEGDSPDDVAAELKALVEFGRDEEKKQERRRSFYRSLFKFEYLTIINPNSVTGERAKNLLFRNISLVLREGSEDAREMALYSLPRSYIVEAYQQRFLDVMFNENDDFRNDLIVRNAVDDTIWIMNKVFFMEGDKMGKLIPVSMTEVEKDGYKFSIPSREEHNKSTKITLKNISDFVDPLDMAIYNAVKKLDEEEEKKVRYPMGGRREVTNVYTLLDLLDAIKEYKTYNVPSWKRKHLSHQTLKTYLKNLQNSLSLSYYVLGIRSRFIPNFGNYGEEVIGLVASEIQDLKDKTLVNFELFPPNETGFRELEKLLKKRKGIYFAANYQFVAPHVLEEILYPIHEYPLQYYIDSTNAKMIKYFGIKGKWSIGKYITKDEAQNFK